MIRAIRGNKVIAVLRVLHFGCLKPKKAISITEIMHKSLIAVNDLCIFFCCYNKFSLICRRIYTKTYGNVVQIKTQIS